MIARATRRRVAALLAGWLATISCRGASDPAPPRLVVLYATCTLNRSFLGPYDASVGWTPRIDPFARRGVVFRRHQTEAGLSGVTFASLFSGTHATRHGVISQPMPLADEALLITEAFAAAGFEVWFWGGHAMASPALGYAQGVPPAHVVAGGGRLLEPDPRRHHRERESFLQAGDPRFERLLDELARDPRWRALVVTNFSVTHAPYSAAFVDALCRDVPAACGDAPDRWRETAERFWRSYVDLSWNFDATVRRLGLGEDDVDRIARVAELLYRANVHRLDGLFGDVVAAVEARGLGDESALAFTADHGEVLHREGAIFRWNHGFALAPETLGVPWLLVAPGVAPGAWEGVTRSIDIFPTLAGLAGVELPAGSVAGVDLSRRRCAERTSRPCSRPSATRRWSRRCSSTSLARAGAPGSMHSSPIGSPSASGPRSATATASTSWRGLGAGSWSGSCTTWPATPRSCGTSTTREIHCSERASRRSRHIAAN